MVNRIEIYLLKRKLNPSLKGFDYLVRAIELVSSKDYKNGIVNRLYVEVGEFYNTTGRNVERCIRYILNTKYRYMKNRDFIYLSAMDLRNNIK